MQTDRSAAAQTPDEHAPILLPLRSARRFAWPLPDLWQVSSLTLDELRACWLFRRGFMDLKPYVDPEADWASFASWVRSADFIWIPRDRNNRVLATMTYKIEPLVHQGRKCVLLWPEYGYGLPGARKSSGLVLAMLAALALGAVRCPGVPQYVVGTGYISSFLSLCRGHDQVFINEDSGMTEWERSLWRMLAQQTAGYDPQTQLVAMKTIPKNPRTDPPKNFRLRAHWQRYQAHNPRWTEGFTCFVFAAIHPVLLVAAARVMIRNELAKKLPG